MWRRRRRGEGAHFLGSEVEAELQRTATLLSSLAVQNRIVLGHSHSRVMAMQQANKPAGMQTRTRTKLAAAGDLKHPFGSGLRRAEAGLAGHPQPDRPLIGERGVQVRCQPSTGPCEHLEKGAARS